MKNEQNKRGCKGVPAAFFDIDGTLYREGLIKEVFKKLLQYELVDQEDSRNVQKAFELYDNRQGNYDEYLEKVTETYKKAIKGLPRWPVSHIAKQVVDTKGGRVYKFTRDQIRKHQKEGIKVFTISGSPIELVEEMAQKYGFDDFRGTIYPVDEKETFTSEEIPMWDANSKEKAIGELAGQYNIDLDASYAYGDTTGDFSMFKMVGHPYAVNPTRDLLEAIAADEEVRKKIKIIVERKDMMYQIQPEELFSQMEKEKEL